MTKRKQPIDISPVLLRPFSVEEADIPLPQVEMPPGHVYIVALNEDGTEKENSGFFYPEKNYKRIYGNEAKYSVKKKVQ